MSRAQLMQIMDRISHPKRYSLKQKELEQAIEDFCAGCPDPVQAYALIAENPDPMTDEALVDRAMSMVCREMSAVPTSIVPASHVSRVTN